VRSRNTSVKEEVVGVQQSHLNMFIEFHIKLKVILYFRYINHGYNVSGIVSSINSFLVVRNSLIHVKWVPCHPSMARPHVADGGDGLQVWRVAVNILNKQSRTADRGWSSGLGLGGGLTTHHRRTPNLLRNIH
jgi:hypothetical protein